MSDISRDDDPVVLVRGADPRVIVAAAALPIATIAAAVTSLNHVQALVAPTAPVQPTDTILAGVWVAATVLGAILAMYFMYRALTKTVFRIGSVELVTLGRVRRSMRYADCERFTFRRTRAYLHGLWFGSYFDLRLMAKGRKRITLSGMYGEWPTPFGITVFKKRFRGDDEIDRVPPLVGIGMSEVWDARLAAGETIRWLEGLTLTDDGVIPRSGPLKRVCVPYDRVLLSAETIDVYGLEIVWEPPMGVDLDTRSANFWPGAILIERRGSLGRDEGESA